MFYALGMLAAMAVIVPTLLLANHLEARRQARRRAPVETTLARIAQARRDRGEV